MLRSLNRANRRYRLPYFLSTFKVNICHKLDEHVFVCYDSGKSYREDYRCGGSYLAPNGEVAQCNPNGIYPCCSPYEWCGITVDHCDCDGCIDYRRPGEHITLSLHRHSVSVVPLLSVATITDTEILIRPVPIRYRLF